MPDDDIGEQLAGWGKVARIRTRGRITGRELVVAVGFVQRPDQTIAIAAGSPDTDWALNLLANPECEVVDGAPPGRYRARPLGPGEAAAAVRDLILRYGTPAERLGAGPAFVLEPA